MFLSNEKKEIINNYMNRSFLNKLLFPGKCIDISKAFMECFNSDYRSKGQLQNKLINMLWTPDIKHIKDVFAGSNYKTLKYLLGDELGSTFKNIWDRSTMYTYSTGYYRRSYRTDKSSRIYMNKNINKLEECIYLAATNFSLDEYFSGNKVDYKDISVIADIISVEIDKGNSNILNKIRDVIYNDNNAATLTREIIRGALMSKSEEAHRMIGELLLAAKLQEGLRQSIVESMDECSKEGFIYLMKVIIDNNLSRFSSIVRAFDTWTGLGIDNEKPRTINKCLDTAYRCLNDKSYLNECINSMDNLLIYIGLWAVAFDEVEDIDKIIYMLVNSKEKYKKLVAFQFLYETQFTVFRHKVACSVLMDKDLEVLTIAILNLFGDISLYNLRRDDYKSCLEQYYKLDGNCYGVKLFYMLKAVVDMMPKKEIEFKESVFPWVTMKLTASDILDKMIYSAALSIDNDMIEALIDYKNMMSPDARQVFIETFLKTPKNIKQKLALIEFCGDRSQSVRASAYKIVDDLILCKDDYLLIEDFLQYKSGDLRKNVIKLLLKQQEEKLLFSIERLLESKNENKRLGAIDIVSAMEGDCKYKRVYDRCFNMISSMNDATQREKILAQNITSGSKNEKTLENGFLLYDKSKKADIKLIVVSEDINIKSIFHITFEDMKNIIAKFSNLIYENRDLEFEYTGWDGTKITDTLGGCNFLRPLNGNDFVMDNYPIGDKVRALARECGLDCIKLCELDFYFAAIHRLSYSTYVSWYDNFLNGVFSINKLKSCLDIIKIPYYNKVGHYIRLLVGDIEKAERFNIGKRILEYLYTIIPTEKHYDKYKKDKDYIYYGFHGEEYIAGSTEIGYWLKLLKEGIYDDVSFKIYFEIAYNYYRASKYHMASTLTLEDFGRALKLGIIDENEVYKEFMERPSSPANINRFTNVRRKDREDILKYKELVGIGEKAVDTIAGIEVKRGELNTEVTCLASQINKCFGANIFTAIILNLEKDTYVRGYNFVSGDCTKKQMLSHLLKCCYPKEDDDENTLRELIKDKKITNKQLIEAAMYSPQWLDIISEYLNIKGLKSACWYFHAHVNDYFSDEKSSIVARYSPISVQDFKDGAFDREWFMDAYKTIGDKNFKVVYDSAKYIAGGGLHKRSQMFADAVLGRLDADEVKHRIMDKRNKDYLLSYGLIPIKDKEDLLNRYEYIHQYIKESKQFGAQRQASEVRSANIALLNLARNAGYRDINRLTWNMETAKIDSIKPYLDHKSIEDVDIQIVINDLGSPETVCTKDGRVLKDIPSKLKKYEYVQEIKEVKKSLKDQYVRAKQSFETSMENGDLFDVGELTVLCKNPVLSPIIKSLVFASGERMGYFREGSFVDYKGERYGLKPEDKLVIAHPVHLYESGNWSNYQRDIYNKKLIQPFRQVFRELYMPNADELKEQTQSRRYAGYQIQPKKAAALLKTRGWLASYEEGLQKVYYKENIIATIYALADWFSPSDIEAPTIELVRFEDRKTFKPITIDNIPKLIFSEVMRDVDLVVSVAHVGGVDPEASLSTIEIRRAIAQEILYLLKLKNVELKESHAYITGLHGDYTVHLGSGTVHKMGTGSINILPIHSSHRGRLFLPFIDDNPKSAEIMSKIILLAEDNKIKDPSILEQII